MHFEILIEDLSGRKMLEFLMPKILGKEHTFRIHSYRGIGRIPKKSASSVNAGRRILLNQLPRILRGYGNTKSYAKASGAAVIVVCDLDDRCLKTLRAELHEVLNECDPMPETRFCIAIEEGEAWLLGDVPALRKAYPKAKDAVLKGYVNDSICGTWEILANAVFPGGVGALSSKGWQAVGAEKSTWAEKITPHMNVNDNASPSFAYFKGKILELAIRNPPPPI